MLNTPHTINSDPSTVAASATEASAAGATPSVETLRQHFRFLSLPENVQKEQLERFKGICALYGYEGFLRLQNAHAVVIGNGGVGSWIAESLCRTGVGTISLVDFDDIELSNSNRQLHTLSSTLGQGKAQTLGARLQDINPYLKLHTYSIVLSKDNVKDHLADILGVNKDILLSGQEQDLRALPTPSALAALKLKQQDRGLYGQQATQSVESNSAAQLAAAQWAEQINPHLYVAEAIDDLFAKASCIDLLHRARIPVVTSGGAGGRIDPSRVRLGDIAHAHGDQLIKRLRTELRRNYGYPKGPDDGTKGKSAASLAHGEDFKIMCSYSDEPPRMAKTHATNGFTPEQLGLNTLGELPSLPNFGASMSVTASAGLLLASVIIRWIVGDAKA